MTNFSQAWWIKMPDKYIGPPKIIDDIVNDFNSQMLNRVLKCKSKNNIILLYVAFEAQMNNKYRGEHQYKHITHTVSSCFEPYYNTTRNYEKKE